MDLSQIDKVELHCHLLGVVSPALLSRINAAGSVVLVEPDDLRSAGPIFDLASFKRWMDRLKPYQSGSADALRPVLAAHMHDLVNQQVRYAEIMISPTIFPTERRALLDAAARWRAETSELEQGRIQIEFVMSIPRSLPDDLLAVDVENFLLLARSGVIAGVALVGPETGESIARFQTALSRWRDSGLGIEIHAGEHAGPSAIREALNIGRPNRIGHGLAAFSDPELIDRIRAENVHIEFCPTSNRCTAAVSALAKHPAQQAKRLGLRFSLNSDDPGAFGCSLLDEFQYAADAWGFDRADFDRIFRDSLAARFQPSLRIPQPKG